MAGDKCIAVFGEHEEKQQEETESKRLQREQR